MVTVNDSATGQSYTYDASKPISTSDDGLAFYQSQLAVVESKIYETKYRNIVYEALIPIDASMPEYVDSVETIYYDAVTMGKFIGANAKDLPESTISAGKFSTPVFYGGNSYSYSLDELRKSQQLRMPLDATKGRMSYRGFQEHAQRVAFFGDADRGITGLFNNANVSLDNASVDWGAASGDELQAMINGVLINVWEDSAEVHVPNTLLLPSDLFAHISSKKMDSGTDTTVLQYIKMNNLYKELTGGELNIVPKSELKTAGTTAGYPGRIMAYELNEDNLYMPMPMMWRSLPPQPEGLAVVIPAEYKFGGVAFRYPGAAAYRDVNRA